MSGRSGIWMLVALFANSGCANISRNAGFFDVQQEVGARADAVVIWYQDEQAHTAFQAEVQSMLTDTLTLEEAVRISLLNNQKLQAEYESLGNCACRSRPGRLVP